jgi:hypothetical protein
MAFRRSGVRFPSAPPAVSVTEPDVAPSAGLRAIAHVVGDRTGRHAAVSFDFSARVAAPLSRLSPRALAWSASRVALVLVPWTGLIANNMLNGPAEIRSLIIRPGEGKCRKLYSDDRMNGRFTNVDKAGFAKYAACSIESTMPVRARSAQGKQVFAGCERGIQLDSTVTFNHSPARWCEHRAATPAATRSGFHNRRAQTGIEFLDEFPGAPI